METRTGSVGGGRKGFFGSLFDLSFTSFVTGRVVSFLYVVSLVLVVINVLLTTGYLSILLGAYLSGSTDSTAVGIIVGALLFLIVTPILLLLSMVYVRVLLEIVVVLFRISDNTAETVRLLAEREDAAAPRPTAPPWTDGTTEGSADTNDEGRAD
jgi:ABC-type transport system involved in multi-copper enzyme maturation permease subunit